MRIDVSKWRIAVLAQVDRIVVGWLQRSVVRLANLP
jgi:hypothetical protein